MSPHTPHPTPLRKSSRLLTTVVLLLLVSRPCHGQFTTPHDQSPWGAAITERGPAGAEDMIWAQLGHSAKISHLATQIEIERLQAIEDADRQLAAGTYKPALDAPPSQQNVPALLAATLKRNQPAFQNYPKLAEVWSRPPSDALTRYLEQRYQQYVTDMKSIGSRANDLATACSYLVESEYRVLDPAHRIPSPADRASFRGTCIATIARAEKSQSLTTPETRSVLAQTLAIVGSGYNERLQYAQSAQDTNTKNELTHFVAADFERSFRIPPSQLPVSAFPCVLLYNPAQQCAAGLPTLNRLLASVVARNP